MTALSLPSYLLYQLQPLLLPLLTLLFPPVPSSNSLTPHLKPAQSFSVISNKNPFAPLALDLNTFPETSSVASASPPSAQGEARPNL